MNLKQEMSWLMRIAQICLGACLANGPGHDDWKNLNISVGGRLEQNVPMALPCFARHNDVPHVVDETACALVRENYTMPAFRATIPGTAMNPQDDICLSVPQDQCLLDNTVTPAGLPATTSSCNQGNLPTYRVTVQEAADVTAAFAFARAHNITISVKNSGHDYMTRNLQRDSLLLWVHELQNMTYHQTFVPEGCSAGKSYSPVLTVGTGVLSDDATIFATAHNTTLLVGSSATVAVSGGWSLGAGHSVLSPVYGLGIDRVVQFTIVTPDGVLRVANACQNEDLFWALRGGGGGTFGVVIDVSHRVEAGLTPVAVANMTLPANITAEVGLEWIKLQAQHALQWGKEGWGGHGAGSYLTHVNPTPSIANLSDEGAVAAADSMRAATDFVRAHGGTSVVEVLPSWNEAWQRYIKPEARPVGSILVLADRLWPRRLFETDTGVESVVNFTEYLSQQQGVDPRSTYIPADFPFLVPGSGEGYDTNTSAHPSWYSSLWNYGGMVSMAWNSSYEERLQAAIKVTEMNEQAAKVIGPGSGAYVHETSIFDVGWRQSFWGSNYEGLLKVKQRYDPDMLMRCWKCVGFEESQMRDNSFPCQSKLQVDADSFFKRLATG
ncbi:hypothetical protein N0V93_010158 [Gnomoniopsis smithogilvyi]|uniref:FAD-binding PCMH-type domain-containing protein n=1 Tax=Gnomoniopsis smithogilvyi TaxID=1191159 RepID=A0A9W8YLG1_9PEZI|nr:hypothetical protein N0V93_010158 [Gnomoniopsis smithogilvyi]